MTVGSSSELNKSESSFLSHTASLLAAMYSDSSVLWAMEPCFLLDQEIIYEPNLEAISGSALPIYCISHPN
jgi:hypothetical protein